MTLNTATISDMIRERLIWLQENLEGAVRKAFADRMLPSGMADRGQGLRKVFHSYAVLVPRQARDHNHASTCP
jgi:hypothetical protein